MRSIPRPSRFRSSYSHSIRAFTLVEVALAMGIVSFAMVSMLAMVPMGVNAFRQAANTTIQSHLVQSVSTQLQMTSFSGLANTNYYYDIDGNSVTSTDSHKVYNVAVVFPQPTSASLLSSLTNAPVGSTSPITNAVIQISGTGSGLQTNVYSIAIANRGQ